MRELVEIGKKKKYIKQKKIQKIKKKNEAAFIALRH